MRNAFEHHILYFHRLKPGSEDPDVDIGAGADPSDARSLPIEVGSTPAVQ